MTIIHAQCVIPAALAAVAPDLAVSVTLGANAGGGRVGYDGGSFGSTVPSPPVLNGQTIDIIESEFATWDFKVHILGVFLAQTFFDSVTVEDGGGSPQTFFTSAATFSSTSSRGSWHWGSGGASLVWVSTDEFEVHPADFFL